MPSIVDDEGSGRFDGIVWFFVMIPNSLRKRLNLATTKPNPMRAMLVRSHARKVRSLAKCSVDRSDFLLSDNCLKLDIFTI